MAEKSAKLLKEWGYAIEDHEGGMVRMKGGAVEDKFVPVDGGYHYYILENGQWVQRLHHIDLGPNGEHYPEYLWPHDFIEHVYGHALEERARLARESEG